MRGVQVVKQVHDARVPFTHVLLLLQQPQRTSLLDQRLPSCLPICCCPLITMHGLLALRMGGLAAGGGASVAWAQVRSHALLQPASCLHACMLARTSFTP